MTCIDSECMEGITIDRDCNGFGVLNPKGKRYRVKRDSPIPAWAVDHDACNGTGLVRCGCRELSPEQAAVLVGGKAAA